jgi:hypothetical protein
MSNLERLVIIALALALASAWTAIAARPAPAACQDVPHHARCGWPIQRCAVG